MCSFFSFSLQDLASETARMSALVLLLTSLPFVFSSPPSTAAPLAPSAIPSQPAFVPPTFTQKDHQTPSSTAVPLLGSPHPFIHCPIPNPVWQDCPLVADCQRIIRALFPRPREPPPLPPAAPGESSSTGPPRSEPTFARHHHNPQVFFKRNGEEGESNELTKLGEVDESGENGVYTGIVRDPYALPRRFVYGSCETRVYLPSYGPQTERASWAEVHAAAEDMLRSCQRRGLKGDMVIGKQSYARVGWQRRLIVEVRRA